MQRRKFITDTLKSLPLIFLTPTILSTSCHEDEEVSPNGKTVVIIGAGISGLAAAKKLQSRGFTVIVLEAQDRIGGRLRTNRSLGFAFDEGASWIHGVDGNPITALAKKSGITTFFTDSDSRINYDIGGVMRSDAVYNQTEEEYYAILETLGKSGSVGQSFETVFTTLYPSYMNNRLWKFFLSTYFTFDRGDLDKVSSLHYDKGEEFGGEERIITNGYDKIPIYLANGIDVRLNQRVTKINYTAEKIQVTHNNTTSDADYVLVTVPLGVLKKNVIEFIPALPTKKQTAIQKIGMNCVNKFLLTWDSAFWDDEQYISYTPETRDKFNYFVNVKKFNPSVNALMTFAYADYARLTESMTDTQVIDEIMVHLKDIYGNSIPYPTHLLRTKWNSNPNTYGSYAFTAVETEMHHFDDVAEEINDKLFFAGEYTNRDYFSNVHGAYLSGLREADKIINLV